DVGYKPSNKSYADVNIIAASSLGQPNVNGRIVLAMSM
ncbi:hypothetical protein Tco_1085491, partial [Tanacetum coccineum]